MKNINYYIIIKFILGFLAIYIYDEFLFYKTLKFYCKKNKGVCSECSCWSCPRKLYIDEYKIKMKSKSGS